MHILEGQHKVAFVDFDAWHYKILHSTCFG